MADHEPAAETRAFEFDVALSFAGPDREVAGVIARIAQTSGLRVFFDESYAVRVWGTNLIEELADIYATRARFCLIIVSRDYLESAYTKVERRAALDRAIRERGEYILPVVLDDAWIPGLPASTAYMDLRRTTIEAVAIALVRKVRGEDAPVSTAEGLIQKVHALPPGDPVLAAAPARKTATVPLRFALVRLGSECRSWREDDRSPQAESPGRVRSFSSGNLSEDPVFDITLVHDGDGTLLIDRVGIEFTRAGFRALMLGGAGGQTDVKRRDTFVLELPDLWARMAAAPTRGTDGGSSGGPIDLQERAHSRLPDPLLLDGRTAYRFALVLFDYAMLIPNDVRARFLVHSDRGDVYSDEVSLGYVLGGDYAGYARVFGRQDFTSEPAIRQEAERLWRRQGQPQGRDREIWLQAERELGERARYVSLRPRAL
jgi:hypothetical protein